MWLPFSLVLCASYASANIQMVLDRAQQQAMASCSDVASDDKPVSAVPDGQGGWKCVGCQGEIDADSDGLVKGCSAGTQHSSDPHNPANAKCCPTGTSYTFDAIAGKGDCCPPGLIFLGTICTAPTPPALLASPPVQTKSSCSGCGNGNVCSTNGHLGIQYGHCYTMTDTNGKQIQRDESNKYKQQDVSNDKFIGLVFRICNSTVDCTQKQDQYVPEGGNWLQLDQNGWRDGNSPGWMIFTDTWLLAMNTVWSTQVWPVGWPLANFTGKGSCFFGQCAISLQFGISDNSNLLGMASYGGQYLSRCANLNSWKPYYYEEVACGKEINAWSTT